MRLLILCDTPSAHGGYEMRAALSEQFQAHNQAIEWLEPGERLATEFVAAEEPALVIDCLGSNGNPCHPHLSEDAFAQLLECCNQREWVWLLLSDGRVFPPLQKRRFVEADEPGPTTIIGQQLLRRERFIADSVARHVVLRVGPMISAHGANPLTQVLQRLRGELLRSEISRSESLLASPETQRFCPTPADDVARVIAAIHNQLDCGATCWGAYHYESADPVTGAEFVEVVLAAAAQFWPLAETTSPPNGAGADNEPVVFPLLNCQRIRDTFGVQQLPWRRAIPALVKEIHAGDSSSHPPA